MIDCAICIILIQNPAKIHHLIELNRRDAMPGRQAMVRAATMNHKVLSKNPVNVT
jgi:hypothetical protein